MKTPLRALVGAIILLVAMPVLGQTPFPAPNENIWIDATRILYGIMPITTLGTNAATAGAGTSLQFDGVNLYWGSAGSSSTNPAPVTYVSNLYATTISNVNVAYITNAYITNLNVSYTDVANSGATSSTHLQQFFVNLGLHT